MNFDDTKKAIAKVIADNRPSGTAFYIGGSYVLTALHVVADITSTPLVPAKKIDLKFHYYNEHSTTAIVVEHLYDLKDDWVVLRCADPPEIRPLELGSEARIGNSWLSFGYPDIQIAGLRVSGVVKDPNSSLKMDGDEVAAERVIQLSCEEAQAGNGAALHGLSGGPCLVDGLVVGIIRCGLEDEDYDGMKVPKLYSVAGTVYATPANRIIEKQEKNQLEILSGTWATKAVDIPDFCATDFIVLLSQKEPPEKSEKSEKYLTLRSVVEDSYRLIKGCLTEPLTKPCFIYASKMISSEEHLENSVSALCRAKVVVFDATGFEPAIMFLAGIRAVVRRGVTILSIGGNFYLGDQMTIPFNITDANIMAHSYLQDKSRVVRPISLLTERIRNGLSNMYMTNYLDLPVYDAIRKLPLDRRGIIPSIEGVLVLCPFSKKYNIFWETHLKNALDEELTTLRQNQSSTPLLGVSRSFELNSPRLVTHAVYEHIRRAQSCVIDLSGWSPNVLFELGVRLAASAEHTACIINKNWKQFLPEPSLAKQYYDFASYFVPEGFCYDAESKWQTQKDIFRNAFGISAKHPKDGLLSGSLHKLVEQKLDIDSEPASRPVYQDLQDQAALFSRDPGSAGRSKPVGLFPGNSNLVEREGNADFERLAAAFFFISNRYESEQILSDPQLCDACYSLGNLLFERHKDRLTEVMKKNLNEKLKEIEQRK